MVWGRLKPAVTAKAAQSELQTLTDQRRKLFPADTLPNESIRLEPGGRFNTPDARARQGTEVLTSLALLILAVACANLGGLLLARGVTREHELSIRVAIGASRQRIFRQLFTESLLLALLGSTAGLIVACVTLHAFLNFVSDATHWMSSLPDWRVVLFVLGLTLVTAVLFGLTPALQMARQQQRKTMVRQVLIAAQVAASCILVINASLLVRGAQHVLQTDPGYGYQQVVSIQPGLGSHGYSPAAARSYFDQLQARLLAHPEIVSVSLVKYPPLAYTALNTVDKINGHNVEIYRNWIDPGFFRTMDISLELGRSFVPGEKNVVILSRSLAERQWPGQNPIGKLDWEKHIVVGVVGNAHTIWFQKAASSELYAPVRAQDMPEMSLVLKTSGAPGNLLPMLKATAESLDPELYPEINLLKSAFDEGAHSEEMLALMFSGIGAMAMLLAALGILGLVTYSVSQRTKEIAIRIALGAPAAQLLGSIVEQFRWPVTAGLAAGAAGATALSKVTQNNLHGISNLDPISYVAAISILVTSFAVAALIPARRALRVDVAQALHQD